MTRIEIQHDIRSLLFRVNINPAGHEPGIEISESIGSVDEPAFELLIVGMLQHAAAVQRHPVAEHLEFRTIPARASNADFHGTKPHRLPRIDIQCNCPAISAEVQRLFDGCRVISVRLDCIAYFLIGLLIKSPHAPVRRVTSFVVELQVRSNIVAQPVVHAGNDHAGQGTDRQCQGQYQGRQRKNWSHTIIE